MFISLVFSWLLIITGVTFLVFYCERHRKFSAYREVALIAMGAWIKCIRVFHTVSIFRHHMSEMSIQCAECDRSGECLNFYISFPDAMYWRSKKCSWFAVSLMMCSLNWPFSWTMSLISIRSTLCRLKMKSLNIYFKIRKLSQMSPVIRGLLIVATVPVNYVLQWQPPILSVIYKKSCKWWTEYVLIKRISLIKICWCNG